MSMATYRSERDLAELVKAQIGYHKTQTEWAKKAGISRAYLSDFLAGKRGAGPAILKALGFEPTPYYRKARDGR
jgi:hypothetical protein